MKRGGDTLRKKDSRKEAEKETCSFKETSSETVCSREIREKDADATPIIIWETDRIRMVKTSTERESDLQDRVFLLGEGQWL